MRRIYLFILFNMLLFGLASCIQTRTDRFFYPLKETTYKLYSEEKVLKENKITFFSISFTDSGKTDNEYEAYLLNQFGDFSFTDIKVLDVILTIGFNDDEPQKHDIKFLGSVKPYQKNRYKIRIVDIDDIYLIFDLDNPHNRFFGKGDFILVRIMDLKDNMLLSFDIYDENDR